MMFALPSELLTFSDVSATSTTDRFGNVIPGRVAASPSVRCYGVILPGTSQETRDAGRTRDQIVTSYRAFLEGQVDVSSSARVTWRGLELEVLGAPSFHPDPATGRIRHTELSLVAVSG